ncbi:endomembrane protein 70-domain containing protein [Nitzschia inconspicua]|uniref:Transmembrane 9 superfamily member n=1 Tax=Nitzschia inconspicua TaxID=303405 RepID=A0A9K3M075_9STRA|nr:endomembrane protein 70-domain containing protein [Nitzschia inconspicua]
MASQNLGEFLTGNKIQSSAYSINMLTELYCQKVCQIKLSRLEAAKLRLHIKYRYHNNWILDNLPSAAVGLNIETGEKRKQYTGGFPIGFISWEIHEPFIFNHVNIIIDVHKANPDVNTYRVVGFAVEPRSVKHRFQGNYEWDGYDRGGHNKKLATCPIGQQHLDRSVIEESQIVEDGAKILYTYDVIWKESDVAWSCRWDIYSSEDHLVPAQVHWNSITNSVLVVLFLSLFVISILVRNLR